MKRSHGTLLAALGSAVILAPFVPVLASRTARLDTCDVTVRVRDAEDDTPLPGVTVELMAGEEAGAEPAAAPRTLIAAEITDRYGCARASGLVPGKPYSARARFPGYKTVHRHFRCDRQTSVRVEIRLEQLHVEEGIFPASRSEPSSIGHDTMSERAHLRLDPPVDPVTGRAESARLAPVPLAGRPPR